MSRTKGAFGAKRFETFSRVEKDAAGKVVKTEKVSVGVDRSFSRRLAVAQYKKIRALRSPDKATRDAASLELGRAMGRSAVKHVGQTIAGQPTKEGSSR